MNLDEKKFLFSLTSNWNLAFSLIMNISYILTLTVSLSPKEVTDTLKAHYRGYRYLKISFIFIVTLKI